MKVVILAGGKGRRLGTVSHRVPKPLIPVGGHALLWHVLGNFAASGYRSFVIATGHGAEQVEAACESWRARDSGLDLATVNTGPETTNGDRLARLRPLLEGGPFFLAWCDGLSDIPFREVASFHREHGRLVTVIGVPLPNPYGLLEIDGDRVVGFREKVPVSGHWISAGLFAADPGLFPLLEGGCVSWEHDVLPRLARDGELRVFRHDGFWKCLDTLKDRDELNASWEAGSPGWARWPETTDSDP